MLEEGLSNFELRCSLLDVYVGLVCNGDWATRLVFCLQVDGSNLSVVCFVHDYCYIVSRFLAIDVKLRFHLRRRKLALGTLLFLFNLNDRLVSWLQVNQSLRLLRLPKIASFIHDR